MNSSEGVKDLAGRSLRGGTWLFARRITSNAIRLGATAILARHLSPADFGIVALAEAVLGFITFSQETGVGTYVIYDREKSWEERIHSAFWLNIFVAVALIGLMIALLPVIHTFFEHPDLTTIMAVLGAVFVLRQIQIVPENLLRRRLDYRSLVIRDTVIDIVSATLSLGLVLSDWGLWSLVLPPLVVEPVRLVTIFRVARWQPTFRFGICNWGKISKYSFPLMGINMVSLMMNQGDTLIVGKVLGNYVLGIYNLAWHLAKMVEKNINSIVTNIGMSSFAAIEGNPERMRNAYLRVVRLSVVIAFPILSMMFVLADDLVFLVYGPRWSDSVILLRLLLVYAAVRSMTTLSGTIFNVVGRTDISLKISLWYLPPFVAAILLGVQRGVFEVALGVVIVRSICSLHSLFLASRHIQFPVWPLARSILPTSAIALAVAVLVWLAQTALEAAGAQAVVRALVSISFGLLLNLVGVIFYDKKTYAELVRLISLVIPRVGKNHALLQR